MGSEIDKWRADMKKMSEALREIIIIIIVVSVAVAVAVNVVYTNIVYLTWPHSPSTR